MADDKAKEAPKKMQIEIDGKVLEANPGQMLIEVADDNNIYIPRFCYHKKLSVAANCRMCLVDIEKSRKPSPACATPVMDGMKVFTKNKKTLEYQKSVMEFLLINHPLDCPICDQGGECELQDIALGYGKDVSRFTEGKRVVPDPNLGSLVATDMTRCIHCTRCVRFSTEIAGVPEMGATGRGEHMKIGTFVEKTLSSELSGNMIDVCPVGALTSKPYRFRARAWELTQKPTISPHDGFGSNLMVHARRNELFRVVPKENEQLNETWVSDRDRFSYQGVQTESRLEKPMIKKRGEWETVSWEEAIDFVKEALLNVKKNNGSDKIGAIANESQSVEELYLLQKLLRSLGSNNIDTRLRQGNQSANISHGVGLDCSFEAIEKSDFILTVGSNLRKEIPLLNHRVRKAHLNGAKVLSVHSKSINPNFKQSETIVDINEMPLFVLRIIKSALNIKKVELQYQVKLDHLLTNIKVNADTDRIARSLLNAKNPCVLFGQSVIMHQAFNLFYVLFDALKQISNAKGGFVSFAANAKGAELAGALPYQHANGEILTEKGLTANEMLINKEALKACILVNVEPEADTLVGQKALETLKNTDYVISLNSYFSQTIGEYADIVLPITSSFESDGTFVNLFGHMQSFKTIVEPLAESKPAWKVLRVIGNFLQLDGFNYQKTDDVLAEIKKVNLENTKNNESKVNLNDLLPDEIKSTDNKIGRLNSVSLYSVDSMVRRSDNLSQTLDRLYADFCYVSSDLAKKLQINEEELSRLRICQGQSELIIEAKIDPTLAANTIEIASGLEKTSTLWDYNGEISIEKIDAKSKKTINEAQSEGN